MGKVTSVFRKLKLWLRNETIFGKLSSRNNIAALICRVLYVFPYLEIISSGVVEGNIFIFIWFRFYLIICPSDVCMLATATEFGTDDSWASTVKFAPIQENLELKKLLTVCILYHYHMTGVRMMADEYGFLPSLSLSLNPYTPSMAPAWPTSFKWELINYTLHALPIIARYNPRKYIECSVTTR